MAAYWLYVSRLASLRGSRIFDLPRLDRLALLVVADSPFPFMLLSPIRLPAVALSPVACGDFVVEQRRRRGS